MSIDIPKSTTPPTETGWYFRNDLCVLVYKNEGESDFRFASESLSGVVGAADPDVLWSDQIGPPPASGLTTADIPDSTDRRYVTDVQQTVIGNTSGTNTGDQTISLTGDVTGSGTGSFAATIANSAVTLAKMADIATASLLYRKTAGTGTPEVQTLATLKTDLGLTGTNSGDQTLVGLGGVGTSRTITINGTTSDLSADRTWTVGDVSTGGSYANPSWLTSLGWSKISSTPTTLSGYGITDAQPLDTDLTNIAALTGTSGFLKTNGANTWTVDTNTYLTGNQSITISGDASGSGTTAITLAVSKLNGTTLSGLATGLLKNTTGTGVPSIAVNSDLPTMSSTVGGAVPTPPNTTQKVLDGTGVFSYLPSDDEISAYQALGSVILVQTVGVQQLEAVTSLQMASQTQLFAAVYIPHDMSISGVLWRMNVQGSYTANNTNSLALYSYSGGTLTKVKESTNDGNLWKASLNAFTATPFSGGAYSAAKGLYFVGALYCASATTTNPSLPRKATLFSGPQLTMDFTNSAKLYGSFAAQTSQASTVSMTSIATSTSSAIWFGLW